MKKLFFVFTFVFSLFFIHNVKALSDYDLILDYDNTWFENNIATDRNLNFIDNYLIPTIESSSNRSQFEYIILINNNVSDTSSTANRISVYFYQPLDESYDDVIISNFLRPGYTSGIYFFRGRKLDPETHLSNDVWLTPRNYFAFYDSDINNNDISKINDFLSSPVLCTTSSSNCNTGQGPHVTIIDGPELSAVRVTSSDNNRDITLYDSLPLSSNAFRYETIYYSSHKLYFSYASAMNSSYIPYIRNFLIKYDGQDLQYSIGDEFPTYYDMITGDYQLPVQEVANYGNNTYGFYNNFMSVHDIGVGNTVFNLAVVCETDKPFSNGYCVLDYNDLINYNSNINFFKKSALAFTQLFGSNSGYIDNDKYFIYGFRVLKPFVPNVAGVRIDTTDGVYEVPNANILKVNKYDGGSYTDYAVTFKIDNSNITNTTEIKSMLVLFTGPLESYYPSIPSSFNLSVYRSFKLQMFDDIPTSSDVESFMFENDLSSIDGTNNQNSFFTDTNFNTYGFGGVITTPFRILYALEDYQSCQNIPLPFPYSNGQLQLKCVRNSIPESVSPLISLLQVFLSGFICYRIAVGTLKVIKDVLSPNNSEIEVVDL